MNKHTRPIMLASAISRTGQQGCLMQCQKEKYNTPHNLHMMQHAMLKGRNRLHLRHLTDTIPTTLGGGSCLCF